MSRESGFDPFRVALAGRNVVDASAGTGKTYAITTLVVRLLLERRLRVRDVLVVTFTEAATAELRDRVRRRLRDAWEAVVAAETGLPLTSELGRYVAERRSRPGLAETDRAWLELALEEIDEAPISTIHGFCQRVLSDAALESEVPFEAELIADGRPLRDEAVFDFHSRDLAALPLSQAKAVCDAVDLKFWQGLADKALCNPEARILPSRHDDREQALALALDRLRASWHRAEVQAALAQHPHFTKPPSPQWVPKWLTQIEDLLASPEPPTNLPNGVKQLCRTALANRSVEGRAPAHPAFEALDALAELEGPGSHMDPPAVLAAKRRFVQFLADELPRQKLAAGTMTFDDLLLRLRDALAGASAASLVAAVRRQFKAALIDEFQDTDPVQFAIFEAFFAEAPGPLFLIGDPKQAIYSFRGADVNAYLSAVRRAHTQHHTMAVNWRSDPRLINAVNALFAPRPEVPAPFFIDGISFSPVGPRPDARDVCEAGDRSGPLEVLLGEPSDMNEERIAALVAADICRLLNSGARIAGAPVRPADVAVLTRSNGQAVQVQQELRRLQIPAVLLGDKSVFDAPEATELPTVLAAIVEPTNAAALRRALATELIGLSAPELVALEDDAAGWATWSEQFRSWHEVWLSTGFVPMFRRWLAHEQVQPRLLRLPDGERRITNLLHLMELVHRAAEAHHLGPAGVLHWLSHAPTRADGGMAPEEAQIRLESDEAAVKLTTVHRAKGLEYPVVYCPFVWRDYLMLPSDRAVLRFHDEEGKTVLDLGSAQFPQHMHKARLEGLAENIRLLYVALTRARHRCTLVWGYGNNFKESALASLLFPLATRQADSDYWAPDPFGHLGKLGAEDLRPPLSAWSARCDGAVTVFPLAGDDVAPYRVHTTPKPLGPARKVEARIEDWRRTTSFSAMIAAAAHGTWVAGDEEGGRDRDEGSLDATRVGQGSAEVPLATFPRGAKAGNFFHALLETVDFAAEAEGHTAAVRTQLALHRFPAEPWGDSLPPVLADLMRTPLPLDEGHVHLCDVPPEERVSELEFALPLLPASQGLSGALAEAFACDAETEAERLYAARVGQLPLGTLRGFVKGFVDLVFSWQGRYYVADYKTNHLGPRFLHYGAEALGQAMVNGHYFLQSHLYALALNRHLARTAASYTYEAHFGGVLYLFLRGMSPRAPRGTGVHFHRPSLARMQALDAAFGGPRAVKT